VFSQPKLRNGMSFIVPKPGGGNFFAAVGAGDGRKFFLNVEKNAAAGVVPNKAFTATLQVRRDGVTLLLNREVLDKSDYRSLRMDSWHQIRDQSRLGIACDDPTVFHYVRVVEVTGKGRALRDGGVSGDKVGDKGPVGEKGTVGGEGTVFNSADG